MEAEGPISDDVRSLKEMAIGKRVYETTRYLLVGNRKEGFAVLEVKKETGPEILKKIVDVNVLAVAAESIFIIDPETDVLNPNQLIPLATQVYRKRGKNAIIVLGRHGHVSFAVVRGEPQLLKVEVVDVVPPKPAKLRSMIEDAMRDGLIDKALEIEPRRIDLIQLGRDLRGRGVEAIIFPCESSGITTQRVGGEVLFLDGDIRPAIAECEKLGLVGCDVSHEALLQLLGKNFDRSRLVFEQICPRKIAHGKRPFITKCCKLRQGYEPVRETDRLGVVVPWGARLREIADALNWLLDAMVEEKS